MDNYITGAVIRRLREQKKLTQDELAQKIYVSNKTISKWETGHGLPDISLMEPLAKALGISVIELFSGNQIRNRNTGFDMKKVRFYSCPVCGNIIQSTGEAVVSCCGITLPPLEAESPENNCGHNLQIQVIDDEYYVTSDHPMTKDHYISFIAAVHDNGTEIIKLYPEDSAEARFKIERTQFLLVFCNHHGLFRISVH